MSLETIASSESHLDKLDSACDWFAINQGRANEYKRLLREFDQGGRTQEHILAFSESCEVVDLFEYWRNKVADYPGLEARLRAVVSKGPTLQEDENIAASGNRPRNDAFCFLVAGKLLSADIHVTAVEGFVAADEIFTANDADLTLWFRGQHINVECKRPQSANAFAKLAAKASKQLAHASRGGLDGLIAIDCSAAIRPGGTAFESDSAAAAERHISNLLESVFAGNDVRLERSVIGMLMFARVPGMTTVPARVPRISTFRRDSISSWLAIGNSTHTSGSGLLREIAVRMHRSAD